MYNLSVVLLNIQLMSWSDDIYTPLKAIDVPFKTDDANKYIAYAESKDYPFHVIVRIQEGGGSKKKECSGTIIGIKWILTSDHCSPINSFTAMEKENILVIVQTNETQSFTVQSVNIAESDTPSKLVLLELTDELNFSDSVGPINLPKVGEESAMLNDVSCTSNLVTIGRVRGEQPDDRTKRLKVVSTFRRTPRDCHGALKAKKNFKIEEYCTFNPAIEVVPCNGFAGAPVFSVSHTDENERTLVGITMDPQCHDPKLPKEYFFHRRLSFDTVIWLLEGMNVLNKAQFSDWRLLRKRRARKTAIGNSENHACELQFLGNWDINPERRFNYYW